MAKDDALRQAMETVRRQKRTAHPYFWAAFVLIGDPDNPFQTSDARLQTPTA
jgi:CHAT domain-containing protein